MTDRARIRQTHRPVEGRVKPPGSKSLTIRALVTAGLARGRSHIYGGLAADDTIAMIGALRALGLEVDDDLEPWSITGIGGYLNPRETSIDAGESGLTARIALVLAAFTETSVTVTGRGRLLQRPIDGVVDALTAQGVSIQTTNGLLPATVNGQGGLWGGDIDVDCSKSSQFATALLLAGPVMSEPAHIRVSGLTGSSGYLDSTLAVMEAFGAVVSRTITGFDTEPGGYRPTDYPIEPDASAAVYPMIAAAITGGRIVIEGLDSTSTQPDMAIAAHLRSMGCVVTDGDDGIVIEGPPRLAPIVADLSDAPDGALGLAVACAFADGESELSGLHSLRYKESDRLRAISAELAKIGIATEVGEDTLRIHPGNARGALVDPHGDHRIAMAMAVAGLRVGGMEVSNPGVVAKTWPGFWRFLYEISNTWQ